MASNTISIIIQAKDQASSTIKHLGDEVDNASSKTKSFGNVSAGVFGAVAGVASMLATKAISAVTDSIDAAVKRVDTLNNFPRIMSNFGVSAGDATKMIKDLDKGVRGLPTTLNDIATLAEGFVPLTKNTKEATDTALALNNAILAGGAPAQVQTAALEQFRQALAKGVPDLQDWKTLEMAMPAQLQQVTKELGLGSGNLKDYANNGLGLYKAMKDGKLSMDDFNHAIVKLNSDGVGGLPSLAKQAKNATQGIQTGMTNARTAVTRGVADIIQAIGSKRISDAISGVGRAFEILLNFVADTIDVFKKYGPQIKVVASAMIVLGSAIAAYKAGVLAANAATAIHSALIYATGTRYLVMNGAIIAVKGAVTAATVAQAAWNTVMSLNPIGLVLGAVAALTAIIGLSTLATDNETSSIDLLNNARQRQADLADKARQKENDLRDAQLDVEGANLRVEHATDNYNDAVKTYGKYSLQARDAAYELKQANKDLADSTYNLNQKQSDELVNLGDLVGALDKLNGKHVEYTVNGQNVAAWKQDGKTFVGGAFASGTNYAPGGVAMVGEHGPELVHLPRGAQVDPAWKTRSQGVSSGDTNITISGTINIATPEAADAFWNRIDKTQRLAKVGMA